MKLIRLNRNKIITVYPNIAYVSIVSFQKYVCDKCGKQFTEKRSLTRHMKTHVDSCGEPDDGACFPFY
jgi:transposase-like protein